MARANISPICVFQDARGRFRPQSGRSRAPEGRHIPEHLRSSVFTAQDLDGVLPIKAVSPLPGFQVSEQPV